ncbi:MAG: arylesterase [Desulfuromonas sp.]|nr:MAG: arylesterase [Desulfuromonas sp.]
MTRFALRLTLLGLLLLGGLSACEKAPTIAAITPESTIVAFGDSLTHGTGAGKGQSYPDVLAELLGTPVVNAGIPGETTSGGLKRLPKVLEEYQPQLVILCEGGNDFLRRQSQKRLFDNLSKMIELIRNSGADVILVGVPQLGLLVDTHPDYLRLSEALKIPYEGNIVADLLTDRDYKSDTIHPNGAGYRLMAEAIHEVIVKAQK